MSTITKYFIKLRQAQYATGQYGYSVECLSLGESVEVPFDQAQNLMDKGYLSVLVRVDNNTSTYLNILVDDIESLTKQVYNLKSEEVLLGDSHGTIV